VLYLAVLAEQHTGTWVHLELCSTQASATAEVQDQGWAVRQAIPGAGLPHSAGQRSGGGERQSGSDRTVAAARAGTVRSQRTTNIPGVPPGSHRKGPAYR